MEISLPNIHYFNIDMSKMGLINKEEVRELLKNLKNISLPCPPFNPLCKLGVVQLPQLLIAVAVGIFIVATV